MSDPLSVAGTAVGITSLGILVCQGLVWYLRSVEGKRQEIANDLAEVQTLISIFYSLNDILPKVNQTGCIKSATVRRCLTESEEKLLELQKLLIELRGPQHAATNRDKMREAGRTLVYPFREDKLKSLRLSLRELLHNLHLTIDMASLESHIAHQDTIETIDQAVEDLDIQLQATNVGVQDLDVKVQQNLSQLQSLESTITDALDQINHRISQTEWAIQDLDTNVTGKLAMIEIGKRSLASSNLVTVERLTEIGEKLDSQSAILSQMGIDISRIQDQGAPLEQTSLLPSIPRPPSHSIAPMCDCRRQNRPFGFSFTFWNVQFKYQQQVPGKHRRTCKFFGIDGQTQRYAKARFPLKPAWLSARMILACAEFTTGTSSPVFSVRYKNLVPSWHSPVHRQLSEMKQGILASQSADEAIRLLEGAERAILTLYRDGRASPCDRDEHGNSHTQLFIDTIAIDLTHHPGGFSTRSPLPEGMRIRVWGISSTLAVVMRILQLLDQIVRADDDDVILEYLPLFHAPGVVRPNVQLVKSKEHELVSYIAKTKRFSPGDVIAACLRSDTMHLLDSVPEVMDDMELSPMARAIVSRSVVELERCILHNPSATLESVWGHSTLQLCGTWCQGLRILLTTEARNLVNDCKKMGSHLSLAIRKNCVEAVEILTEAGCCLRLSTLEWDDMSPDCAQVVASRLFERRARLLGLAQHKFGLLKHRHASDLLEREAAELYAALVAADIPVDPALGVDHPYETVYHCPYLPLHYFRIFFESGFRNHQAYDDVGLTPAMVWRSSGFFDHMYPFEDRQLNMQWLQEEGLLDQSPQDPLDIGLNICCTGWHYLAGLYFSPLWITPGHYGYLQTLSRSSARDNCVCWCVAHGEGCSPLATILKNHLDLLPNDLGRFSNHIQRLRHILFQQPLHDPFKRDGDALSVMSQFVRFLTFEALEMTHTCCYLMILDYETPEPPPNRRGCRDGGQNVIIGRDEDLVQETRSDESEQQGARLLDSLMQEFDKELRKGGTSPVGLKQFLKGYWRETMVRELAVDEETLSGMRECLADVETYVLPKRAQGLLGPEFDLAREFAWSGYDD